MSCLTKQFRECIWNTSEIWKIPLIDQLGASSARFFMQGNMNKDFRFFHQDACWRPIINAHLDS